MHRMREGAAERHHGRGADGGGPLVLPVDIPRLSTRSLRLGQNGRSPEVVLVTSALPGEGKTTFAVSLAAFAACTGNRTLLVDFDLRHQRVAQELDPLGGERLDGSGRALSLTEMVQRDPETPRRRPADRRRSAGADQFPLSSLFVVITRLIRSFRGSPSIWPYFSLPPVSRWD
jgi:hypothetical protein